MTSLLRIACAGVAAAAIVGLAGAGMERARFGSSEQAMVARIQSELRDELDAAADRLGAIASRIRATPDLLRVAPRDPAVARALFDQVSAVIEGQEAGRTGVTIYGGDATPIAWAGRVFDLPRARLEGPSALFVSPGAIGPRLIRTQTLGERVATPARGAPQFPGVIVVEQSLARVEGGAGPPDTFVLSTSLVPVKLRARVGPTPSRTDPFVFAVSSRNGSLLVEAEVSPSDLAAARTQWRRNIWAAAISVLGLTLLLCTGPIVESRRRAADVQAFLAHTLALAATVVAALALLLFGVRNVAGSAAPTSPIGLFLIALAALALVAIAVDVVERRRVKRSRAGAVLTAASVQARHASAAFGAVLVLTAYEVALRRVVTSSPLDVLHFSLHPLAASRVAVAFALVLLHAAAIWAAVVFMRAAVPSLRLPRRLRRPAVLGWIVGTLAAVAMASGWPIVASVPVVPLMVAIVASALCALALGRIGREMPRASQAARLAAILAALVIPALAMYPSLFAFAIDAKEQLVSRTYGPDALSQREDLQRRLQQAVDQIDALPSLAEFVVGADTTPADRAFLVWSRTDLAKYRLTSAVELYDADGRFVSRFALHLPEYTSVRPRATSCSSWESLFDEVSPFGSSERHVLRTARGICSRGRIIGTIVVRVMLDYRTLPFISTESPYLESLHAESQRRPEGASGRDVEFAMYGWSRAPIIESGSTVWTLPDRVFDHLVRSREPFWDTLDRGDDTFRVYFLSDRGEIYALGYPIITWPGHVINLAELALLVGVLYALLLVTATAIGALTARPPATARELLREVRSSFYRKLFIFFVGGAVVPVVVLAIGIRTYFATQLRASAVDAAQRTVTTAQRLVEDYAAIQQAGSTALSTLDDQSMVLVWRAIDEDVNLFARERLQATSARDLFASALLSARTPGDVYKSILLDRAPTFVGDEKIGDVPYRLAAAPVRSGAREGIVTVPLTNRQNEIEEQIDELDRRVRAAAVLFSLLGAAIGYWMAERIADPVNRLTRATRRIARGDLNVRIAATSSDELRRLVGDFNQMAADLQRQRVDLERTQRLEAWADMARQVAHDIKNPLTPIQLSAEHARRVNLDRGRPLSPVLDDCVNAILAQVRLLRQISAEFSSFASSPTPRPEATDVAALVEEVVAPYRLGLSGRVAIDLRAPSNGAATAMIDRTLFSRALTNIIENALHAMPGGGHLTITIRDGQPASERRPAASNQAVTGNQQPAAGTHAVVVEVTDTGVGMDEEALGRIFEPYFSTKATGTGLGLTIAKRNVDLNGGQIEVRSRRDAGTTVTIQLPSTVKALG